MHTSFEVPDYGILDSYIHLLGNLFFFYLVYSSESSLKNIMQSGRILGTLLEQ